MNEEEQAYRMKLTHFFYTEYAYRHLEKNSDPEKTLADVKLIKQTLQAILVNNYDERIPDFIVDYHLFSSFERKDCELFTDLLNMRASNCLIDFLTSAPPLETIYSYATRDAKVKMAIGNIAELSFKYGVYVTHLDCFRNKNYSIENLQKSKIDTMLSKLFYRERTISNLSHADVFVSDPGMNRANYKSDDLRYERLAFYIDLHSKTFNFKNVMAMVKAVIAMYIYETQDHQSKNDFSVTSHYIQSFFEKNIHKVQIVEVSNKLAGLLMWDYVNIDKMNKIDAVKKLSLQFCIRPEYKQEISCSGKNCSREDCFRQYCTLHDVAATSISKGRIATAAELETQAKSTTSSTQKTEQSTMEVPDLIGSRLKQKRLESNMTQKALAVAIDVPQQPVEKVSISCDNLVNEERA